MNDSISWHPSLVKKFSSSNYYKLLTQLKNEVTKYPLNNKKKVSSTQSKDQNDDNIKKSMESYSHNNSPFHKSNNINEPTSNKASVNFNNAKNFSIYRKTNNNSNPVNENSESELPNSTEDTPS